MRLIDADAFKNYIRGALDDVKHLYKDNGAWAKEITDSFCMDIDEQPTVEAEPRWTPCSERLPEDGRCLVTRFDFVTNTCFLDILWYEKGVWWNRLYTGDFAVIAWMPLPEPYRGGGKE